MSFLEVNEVTKRQQNEITVNRISFSVPRFQKTAVAGETGSGKSTLVKMIGGLLQPDDGTIFFEEKRVKGPREQLLPGHANMAYLSQHFELRNNYKIGEELDYLNKLRKEEADTLFEVCRINHLLQRRTDQVSGGEKQRISLARLLLSSPKLLLLDEPYSNLDRIHEAILRNVVRDVSEQLQITCLLISHDAEDMLSWADQIIVMKEGAVVQHAAPYQIYNRPASEYVAALFGSYNLLPVSLFNQLHEEPVFDRGKKVLVRPEEFIVNGDSHPSVRGRVEEIRFLGNAWEVHLKIASGETIVARASHTTFRKNETVSVSLSPRQPWFL